MATDARVTTTQRGDYLAAAAEHDAAQLDFSDIYLELQAGSPRSEWRTLVR